ncbi:MAG: RNA methyltransferase [Thermomicrobiales bacterium]
MTHHSERRYDDIIASAANPLIKHIRSLQRRRTRHQERAFVVEGFRAVEESLNAGVALQTVLIRDDIGQGRIDARLRQYPIRTANAEAFKAASDVDFPQGILAVAPMINLEDLDDWQGITSLVVIADGIRDPGNLGTLLRSASAAGSDFVVVADESVDPYNPKVVRAAMGAHFQLPVYEAGSDRLGPILDQIDQIVVADAAGDHLYDEVDYSRTTAIVVGGEAFGPLKEHQHPNLITVRIPLARNVESLNAGVAGSLLLFEAARHRRRSAAS